MMLRLLGICEDGGGVMDEVVGGAGDVNLTLSAFDCPGEPGLEDEPRLVGVAGRESSVEGISESWESWDSDAWESILPGRGWPKPRATRQKCSSRVASPREVCAGRLARRRAVARVPVELAVPWGGQTRGRR